MLSPSDILNASILIVDDQDANLRLLERMLREAGYTHIATTLDPQAVCALHRDHQYDLILLDLQMPVMDGFQVMENLQAIETDSYLPVLVITAQPGHKLRALQAGAKDFVSKPFDLIEVKTRIHNMLEVRLLYKQIANHNKLLEQTVLERTADLRESEARFHRLTELVSDWYWEQDENGNFTNVYGPALEMLGIKSNASPDGAKEIDGERRNDAERAELDANMAARRPFLDLVYSRTNPDGSPQYLQVSGEPKFDPSGRFTGYRGIGMDVTSRLRPDETLRRFRAAMDNADDAIFLACRDSMRFVDVNDTACRMFGYSREELLSLGPMDIGGGPRDKLESLYDRLIAGDADLGIVEDQRRRKDGTRFPAEIHRRAQRSGNDWIIVKVVHDISERKLAELRTQPRAAERSA